MQDLIRNNVSGTESKETQSKPVVMTLVDWYPPAYKAGGPVKSVANLCDLLKDSHLFKVITGNTDIDNSNIDTESDKWLTGKSNEKIIYLSGQNRREKIKKLLKEETYDILHLNGIFSFNFSVLPLIISLSKQKDFMLIVSPRGMLSQSALNIKSIKKKLFLFFSKVTGLYRHVIWHATSDKEISDIKSNFGKKAKIRFAPNIPSKPKIIEKQITKKTGYLNLVCITRISPVKNLSFIFEILKKIPAENQVEFNLYGPAENKSYETELKLLGSSLPLNIKVNFKGTIEPSKIPVILAQNHVFILPTLGENYGHSIYEALSAGIPVIISDQTPWKDLKNHQAGFDLPLNELDAWIETLQFFIEMQEADWKKWSEGAFQFANKNYQGEMLVEQYRKLYFKG